MRNIKIPKYAQISERYPNFYQIVIGIILVIIGLTVGANVFGNDGSFLHGNALAYWTNVATEALSVLITILVINQIIVSGEQGKLKKRLVRQAGSPVQAVATEAVAQLREEGWLVGEKGLLKGANLRGANLAGADLTGANLQDAKLYTAVLSKAILEQANLMGADLREADLSNARMYQINCEGAVLSGANLQHAVAWEAVFRGARLENTNLSKAQLPQSDFTSANLSSATFSGANLKSAILLNTNIIGTSFEGATLLRALIEPSAGGMNIQAFPKKIFRFTILPDGRAIDYGHGAIIEEIRDELPDLKFVAYEDLDWVAYTDSSHPQYRSWDMDWARKHA